MDDQKDLVTSVLQEAFYKKREELKVQLESLQAKKAEFLKSFLHSLSIAKHSAHELSAIAKEIDLNLEYTIDHNDSFVGTLAIDDFDTTLTKLEIVEEETE